MAFGAILAARDLGLLVPHDVSIIGIDGHDQADFFGLSTVAQHPRHQGAHAAEVLLAELTGSAAPASEVPFELITRTSTARPRP
jgi:DNA-binding LacI/PurR family transcriptional regulator